MEYKILILRNNLSFNIVDDCVKITEYFKTRVPFPVTFEFKDVSIPITVEKYSTFNGFDNMTGKPKVINLFGPDTAMLTKMRPHFSPNYAVTVLAWDKSKINVDGQGTSYTKTFDGNEIVCLATDQDFDRADFTFKSLVHEIMHTFCFKLAKQGIGGTDEMDTTIVGGVPIRYYKNDFPESPDGNFAKTLKNISPYFDRLVPKKGYKYFSQKEVDTFKLKPELWSLLDTLRGNYGFPIVIASGLRDKDHNKNVGGVEDSSHLLGLAVDINVPDSARRFKLVTEALKLGFRRIGVGKTFVHLDIDKSKPQDVMWDYY